MKCILRTLQLYFYSRNFKFKKMYESKTCLKTRSRV